MMKKLILCLVLMISQVAFAVADANLVAYYPCNEANETNAVFDSQQVITPLTGGSCYLYKNSAPTDANCWLTITNKALGSANTFTFTLTLSPTLRSITWTGTNYTLKYNTATTTVAWAVTNILDPCSAFGNLMSYTLAKTGSGRPNVVSAITPGTEDVSSRGIFHGNISTSDMDDTVIGEDFEVLSDWTDVNGTASLNANGSYYKTGSYSLKITPDVSAVCSVEKTISWTVDANYIEPNQSGQGFWCYIPDTNDVNNIVVRLSATSDYLKYFYINTGNITDFTWHSGWNFIPLNRYFWTAVGGATWKNTFIKLKFLIYSKFGKQGIVYLDSYYKKIYTKPVCMIMFDDGAKTVYSAAKSVLDACDVNATCYIISDLIGSGADYMTTDDLNDLYADGWAISNHTKTHDHLDTLDEANQVMEIQTCRDYLLNLSYTDYDMAYFLAYPFGAYDANTIIAMENLGVICGRIAENETCRWWRIGEFTNPYTFPTFYVADNTVTAEALEYYINLAASYDFPISLLFHNITDDAGVEKFSAAKLATLADYLKSNNIDGITVPQYYSRVTNIFTTEHSETQDLTKTSEHTVTGKIDRGLSFNGTTDYIDPNRIIQDFNSNFSISLWAMPDDGQTANYQGLFGNNDSVTKLELKITPTGYLWFLYQAYADDYETNAVATSTSSVFTNGQQEWHFIVVTAEQTDPCSVEIKIYFDGNLVGTGTNVVAPLYDEGEWWNVVTMSKFGGIPIAIGNTLNDGAFESNWAYAGGIDDVRIYDKKLTTYEVASIYFEGMGLSNWPEPNDVRYGQGYIIEGVPLTGTMDLPEVNEVRQGIQFDGNSKTGTYKGKRRMSWW